MSTPTFRPGDECYVTLGARAWQKRTVTKVGRKYVFVGTSKFRLDTGALADGYTGHIRTVADHEAAARRTAILDKMRAKGVEVSRTAGTTWLPTETLEKLLAVLLEEDKYR